MYDFIAIGQIKLEFSSGNGAKMPKSGENSLYLARTCDLDINLMTFKNNRDSFQYPFKLSV